MSNNKISFWDFAKLGGNEQQLLIELAGMWADQPEEFEIFCNSVNEFKSEYKKIEDGHVEPGFENLCSGINHTVHEIKFQKKCQKTGENFGDLIAEAMDRFAKK